MRKNILIYLRSAVIGLLCMLTFAAVYITEQNTQAVRILAMKSLESTALSLSFSADKALRLGESAGDEIRTIFSDQVIAYALVAKPNGRILFHTNRRLEGKQLSGEDISHWSRAKGAAGRRVVLRTGAAAYEYDLVINSPQGEERFLRLVLNTAPVDAIIARAARLWWIIAGVLGLLWIVGILFERILVRYLQLQSHIERQERMALIGRMTAVLAHEIRNALGGIKGFTQWIGERMEAQDERKSAIDAVIRGAERIERLVQELLDFSKDENYRIDFPDLRSTVEEALESSAAVWQGKIEIEIATGIRVRADREKLHRALVNCFKNAIESMGDGGLLKVSASLTDGRVVVRIEDSGGGIAANDLSQLFTPFFTTKVSGTGLGLAYSLKVMEGMGGTMTLSNREAGRGAVVSFYLQGRKQDEIHSSH